VALNSGEIIDFAVGRGADNSESGSLQKLITIITPTTNVPPVVTNPPPACTFALSPSNNTHSADGGTGFVAVATQAGCTWNVISGNSWIHINSSLTNLGSGTVVYRVDLNASSLARTGSIHIDGLNFFVNQDGAPSTNACLISISPTGRVHSAASETAFIDVTVPPGCSWTYNNTNPWISTLPIIGSSNGAVQYTVAPNFSALSRSGVISVSGLPYLVTQLGTNVTVTNPPPTFADFNASRDFSTNSNPNGVWSYGWKTNVGGALSLLPSVYRSAHPNGVPYDVRGFDAGAQPLIMHHPLSNTNEGLSGGTGHFPPGTLVLNPGVSAPQNLVVVRFTAPSNGNYQVEAAAAPGFDGSPQGDTDFHVIKNGTELFGEFLTVTQRAGYTNVVALNSGEIIDFAVGRGADNSESGSLQKLITIITPTTNVPPSEPLNDPNAGLVSGLKRLGDGAFQIVVEGLDGTYAIEVSANLVDWTLLQTIVNSTGSIQFSDPDANGSPNRFYRARLIQN
ncbi:MAG TPA: hypothetical protein VK530_06090, partial [Candidatus Acidoferrum sp.]|nr:hypothetical protein [Candidatus Acidoferrum sp.]